MLFSVKWNILLFSCIFYHTLASSSPMSSEKEQPQTRIFKEPFTFSATSNFFGISMLEISTRPWLFYLTQKYQRPIKTLLEIPKEEFIQIANQGIEMVWLMGVWQLGQYGLDYDRNHTSSYGSVLPDWTMDDIIGSPYAITNYTCNTELGLESDLISLRNTLHSVGLLMMLDFVPNHSAVDCLYTETNPDYYIRSPKNIPIDSNRYLPSGIAYGSSCSGCGSWPDTAQFNYWNPTLADIRTKELLRVASIADAIRCDMAYLLLNDVFQQTWSKELSSWNWNRPDSEWWKDSISFVKSKYPKVVFLAEVYDQWASELQSLGFDYTYDKSLYDKLGEGNLDKIRQWISTNSVDYLKHSAHFVANHDERRAVDYFGSWWRADAAALITYTLPGMQFYWMWDDFGFKNKLDVHLRREESEPSIPEVTNFYRQLSDIVNTDVFKKGAWTYLDVFGTGLFSGLFEILLSIVQYSTSFSTK